MALFRKRQQSEPVKPFDCGGSTEMEVVGESFHQDGLDRIAGPKRRQGEMGHENASGSDRLAILKPEPSNQYDSNAVQVLVDGLLVGHLNRDDAAKFQPIIQRLERDHGGPVAVTAQVVGGWLNDDGSVGGHASVWLSYDPECLKEVSLRRPARWLRLPWRSPLEGHQGMPR